MAEPFKAIAGLNIRNGRMDLATCKSVCLGEDRCYALDETQDGVFALNYVTKHTAGDAYVDRDTHILHQLYYTTIGILTLCLLRDQSFYATSQ